MGQQLYQNDHDLLIAINERLLILTEEVRESRDDNSKRINTLEETKLDKSEADRMLADAVIIRKDTEKRLRELEAFRWKAIGIILAVQFLIGAGLLTLVQ